MGIVQAPKPSAGPDAGPVAVEIVVPVYNEERLVESSIRKLRAYLDASFPFSALVTIADNASTDATWERATGLVDQLAGVRAVHLEEKGRGRALRAAWSTSGAEVVAYMDVDLSTGLDALLPLVAPLLSGNADLAIGSRAGPEASVDRPSLQRSIMNRVFNRLVNALTRVSLADTQCGFKAFRAPAAKLLFHCSITERFAFDVEVLSLARRLGFSIHEVPVHWLRVEGSQIRPWSDARSMIRDVIRAGRASALAPPIPTLTVKVPAEHALGSDAPTPVDALRALLPPGLSLLAQDGQMLVLCPLMAELEIDAVATQILAHHPGAALERAVTTMAQLSAMTPLQLHSDQASRSSEGNRTPLRHR